MDLFEFEDYNAILLKNPVTIGEIKRYFNAYDLNSDGFIVSYELGLVLKVFSSRNFTTKEIDDMLAEIEVNFDGKLIYKGKTMSRGFNCQPIKTLKQKKR